MFNAVMKHANCSKWPPFAWTEASSCFIATGQLFRLLHSPTSAAHLPRPAMAYGRFVPISLPKGGNQPNIHCSEKPDQW